MLPGDVARFEFRTFGEDLTQLRDLFAKLGRPMPQPASREHYIVSRLNAEANVKIRGGRVEVKGLLARLGNLEQWRPIFAAKLPVAAADVENVVVPALGLDLGFSGHAPFTEDALLAWAGTEPDLTAVAVDKRRTLFDLGDCQGEVTELEIGDERLQTAAIEAPDPEAARALLAKAGLGEARNEGYPAFLQRRLFSASRGAC